MKKKIFALVLAFIAINYISWPFFENSGYDPLFHTIKCDNRFDCVHEIGHAVDQKMGWISKSDDFRVALANYAILNWYLPVEDRSEIAGKILFFPGIVGPRYQNEGVHIGLGQYVGGWGGTTELYADMLSWVDGDKSMMPEMFVDFYDWEIVNSLMVKYTGE